MTAAIMLRRVPVTAAAHLQRLRRIAFSLGGALAVLAVWQLEASLLPVYVLPSPIAIGQQLLELGPVIVAALPTTLETALFGWLIGNGIAIALALIGGLWLPLETMIGRLGVASHCLPAVALAPILVAVSRGQTPGIILAALGTVFTTLAGMSSGIRYADPRIIEVGHAFNAGTLPLLRHIRLRFGLVGMFNGLLLSVPGSIVGALMSEYLISGQGVGAVIISAQGNLDAPTVWAMCLVCSGVAAVAFGIVSLVRKTALPWVTKAQVSYTAEPSTKTSRTAPLQVLGSLGLFFILAALIWWGALRAFHVTPYVGKTPWDVAIYLATGPDAIANTGEILSTLLVTLAQATAGLACGSLAALITAAAFSALPPLRDALMPLVLVFRAIPLLAMTPALVVAFGFGQTTVIIVASLLSFFPTLIIVLQALDTAPDELEQVAKAYNASRLQVSLKIRAILALPGVFQALRITGTGALLGAVAAEWLTGSDGIGYFMILAAGKANFVALWASVVVITIVSMGIYTVIVIAEGAVRRRLL
ncbi:MAG: ABC transporter permease subunit [Microbacterium sp.]